jgi:hypothetical protein
MGRSWYKRYRMPQTSSDCVQSLQGTGKQSDAIRNGLICAFVVAASVWATYPVAEIGLNDDWSYIKTAQAFAQTGHFAYNGQGAVMLGCQVIWGALFVKLLGFSFTAVRLSILPLTMATIFLFHAVLVRFGINARNAVLGALALGLSPLFIPLAATYMTDVPGLFAIVLCLYLCQRAVAANSSRATIAWLCLAAATNVAGGTVRQIVWLGTLVMVPSAGWLLRKRRGVLLTSSLLWVFSVATIFACMRWYAQQLYSVAEPILKGAPYDPAAPTIHFFSELIGFALCLALLLIPISVAWVSQVRSLSRTAIVRIALIPLLWVLLERIMGWTMPWLGIVIRAEFAAPRIDLWLPSTSLFLPVWAREAISLLAIATTLILVEYLCSRLWPLVRNRTAQINSWQEMFWLLGPYGLSYFILLMPVAYRAILFDRYVLLIMPIAIICLLRLHQELIAPTLPPLSVIALTIFAVLAIAGTHDWFAWSRARLVALNEIRASGVPRTKIQGGFEYDGWTQTEARGYINNSWIEVPAGAYHPDTHPQLLPDDCKFKFASFTPAIHPEFTIIFPRMWCLEPSGFPPVNYRTWLPPFKGTITVQKIPNDPD